MNMRPTTLVITVAIALASLLASDASAAPASLTDRAIDIDLKAADITSVFGLLGRVGSRQVALDPCVAGTVDLRLKNTPLPLVLDALATKLSLTYEDDGATLRVHCRDAPEVESARVSLAVQGRSLADAAAELARAAKLEGVDYRATARPTVNVTVGRVRLGTAISVLADESGLKVEVVQRRLVVSDPAKPR